ncbi:hypothetical protein PGB90_003460 [Kerria lacca]
MNSNCDNWTINLAISCSTSIIFKIVAPSFVTVISPSDDTINLSNPLGPNDDFKVYQLIHIEQFELVKCLSSFGIKTSTFINIGMGFVKIRNPAIIAKDVFVFYEKDIIYATIPDQPKLIEVPDLKLFCIKSQISNNVIRSNLVHTGENNLTALQLELLSIMHEYKDLYYTERTFTNAEEIRFVYCLHAINHALKTRLKIINHNAKINEKLEIPGEFRDQGLVKPKVLIIVPFRNSALRIIKMISSILLIDEKQNIINKKRFFDEFGGDDISISQKKSKPEDYEKTFTGNIGDDFNIGITVTKKSLKLFADFYSSDIIVASPLGLRLIIGAEGETNRDYDFLSSIEVLILDQVEIFLMQNWDHILHIMDHLNLQPQKSHNTDFSRVRSWALNGWTKYYRQNLIFSSYPLIPISALVNQKCNNYAGCIRTNNSFVIGTISQIIISVPQIFYRLNGNSAGDTIDGRFNMFIQKILPHCLENLMRHVLIYIPSYFDFVRIRNYFKTEAISCAQICEYSKDRKVAQARDIFFHNEVNYMLYSERFHFYRRRKIRGIRHLIFYQLPTFPHFYSEMCNLMQEANQNPKLSDNSSISVSVIYSKYDAPQLAAIVSTNRAARMLASDQEIHMFMTDDS